MLHTNVDVTVGISLSCDSLYWILLSRIFSDLGTKKSDLLRGWAISCCCCHGFTGCSVISGCCCHGLAGCCCHGFTGCSTICGCHVFGAGVGGATFSAKEGLCSQQILFAFYRKIFEADVFFVRVWKTNKESQYIFLFSLTSLQKSLLFKCFMSILRKNAQQSWYSYTYLCTVCKLIFGTA